MVLYDIPIAFLSKPKAYLHTRVQISSLADMLLKLFSKAVRLSHKHISEIPHLPDILVLANLKNTKYVNTDAPCPSTNAPQSGLPKKVTCAKDSLSKNAHQIPAPKPADSLPASRIQRPGRKDRQPGEKSEPFRKRSKSLGKEAKTGSAAAAGRLRMGSSSSRENTERRWPRH